METQQQINTIAEITNLESLTRALVPLLSSINANTGGGVQTVTGDIVDETDPLNPVVNASSGTWTPEITGVVGAATVSIIGTSFYTRIGDIVTDVCMVSCSMDTGQSLEEFNVSMAVDPADDFPNARQVRTVCGFDNSIAEYVNLLVESGTGTKTTVIHIIMNGTAIEAVFTIQRTYSVA